MGLVFEWDENKAKSNLKKHGISFVEASTVFGDLFSITIEDVIHSDNEQRFIIIGHSEKSILTVVHLEKKDAIRIISARKASHNEQKVYEENIS